jgi:hypothetical protein
VNPDTLASLVMYAHGLPLKSLVLPPSIIVQSGPLTLCNVRGWLTVTPPTYVPFATRMVSPAREAFTAS